MPIYEDISLRSGLLNINMILYIVQVYCVQRMEKLLSPLKNVR